MRRGHSQCQIHWLEGAICYTPAKNDPIAMKQKQTYRLNSKPQTWPSPLTLAVTLIFNFQDQMLNSLYLGQNGQIATKQTKKHIDWTLSLKCDHRIWTWMCPWPWIFKVKYGNHYISIKNDPIATRQKSKYIDGPIATKLKANISIEHRFDHLIWPSPWPRPWIFKVKYGICYISAKTGPITTKQKANISIEH